MGLFPSKSKTPAQVNQQTQQTQQTSQPENTVPAASAESQNQIPENQEPQTAQQ